ncbi:NACHT domain-containing protein [Actinorugispora endophytica]|uniref:NACHT domain-containing protein n=1 Tax=Actinorugispora endophytica TaxID=1605990 RepID=UPI001AADC6E3|nr:ATP-binding protein [Actinorugispora endophytica]
MKKTLSYTDALRVLGKDDSALLDFAERLADGTLGMLGVPDLFGLREQVLRHGREAITGMREKITGVSRWDRTERIEAANQILRITAFFEALGEVLDQPGSPLKPADLEFTRDEQYALLTDAVNGYGLAPAPLPPAAHGDGSALAVWSPEASVLPFVRGLAVWEGLSDTARGRVEDSLAPLPALAQRRYAESYRKLAADVPEFGVWANLAEHDETRKHVDEMRVGLAGMEELLRGTLAAPGTRRRLTELERYYQAVLDKPMLPSVEAPEGAVLPPVRHAYLNLGGRLRFTGPNAQPSADDWWEKAHRYDDLQPLLVSLLTQRDCHLRPIVLLGHPGAGKSQLTRMLAARLPSGDFLPLRVKLRSVQADAPIRVQVEEGVSATLNTRVSWRELCDSAPGALPVVILDGFDELLQATGVNRSDYLEQVQQFQERQADMGSPVAVIVTSRTVVAERARFPARTPVIRLAPFDEDRIRRLLGVWNRANTAQLTARGLRPLPLETALRYRELAEQPLLLLMLLVFDTDANALQQGGAAFGRGELYERLLTAFAEREVRKHHSHLDADGLSRAVEDELRRLEVVAMAMFVRHRQSVTSDELGGDLSALFPETAVHVADPGLGGRIAPADQVLGRFFFVHEAGAVQRDGRRSVYEFLHATFGEYLVARTLVNELSDLVADREHAARRRSPAPLDTSRFYALSSFAAIAGRAAVVEFAADLLERRVGGDRAAYRALLVELFQAAPYPRTGQSVLDYQPYRATVVQRLAAHTANLVTLLVLVADEVDLAELYPGSARPWQDWRDVSGVWRAMPGDQWHGFLDTVRVRHLGFWENIGARTVLCREPEDPVNVGECVGFELRSDVAEALDVTNPYDITVPYDGITSRLLRSMATRAHGSVSRAVLMLGPYLKHVGTDLGSWLLDDPDPASADPAAVDLDASIPPHGSLRTGKVAWTEVNDVLELRLAPVGSAGSLFSDRRRNLRYMRLLFGNDRLGRLELTVLRQAAEDFGYFARFLSSSGGEDYSPPAEISLGLLRETVSGYLRRVTSVVSGPLLSSRHVRPVLDALRPHLQASEDLDRVCGLAAANDLLDDSDVTRELPSGQWRSTGGPSQGENGGPSRSSGSA